jgi:hypothetical protein
MFHIDTENLQYYNDTTVIIFIPHVSSHVLHIKDI